MHGNKFAAMNKIEENKIFILNKVQICLYEFCVVLSGICAWNLYSYLPEIIIGIHVCARSRMYTACESEYMSNLKFDVITIRIFCYYIWKFIKFLKFNEFENAFVNKNFF